MDLLTVILYGGTGILIGMAIMAVLALAASAKEIRRLEEEIRDRELYLRQLHTTPGSLRRSKTDSTFE